MRPKRSIRRSAVRGLTKGGDVAARAAISLTKREEMNWQRSDAIRKTVSMLRVRRAFIPAIWNA